jgi:hypothetical protein
LVHAFRIDVADGDDADAFNSEELFDVIEAFGADADDAHLDRVVRARCGGAQRAGKERSRGGQRAGCDRLFKEAPPGDGIHELAAFLLIGVEEIVTTR